MLVKLLINNYALIDQLELDLQPGMNVITGETGAGKSILLGALGLILGQRADSESLLNRDVKCIIEGVFSPASPSTSIFNYLQDNQLYEKGNIIVRREVNPEGRSRSFINDIPVSLQQLKEFGMLLVDIHSQHQTLNLNKTEYQLSVLDALAGNLPDFKQYQAGYRKLIQLRNAIKTAEDAEQKSRAEQDYLEFQLNELEEANVQPGEQEQLEQELSALSNAGDIQGKLFGVNDYLSGEVGLISKLNQINQIYHSLSRYDVEIEQTGSRLKSLLIELKDIDAVSQTLAEKFQHDPKRIEQIENRLDIIYRLQKKHRVNSVQQLIQIQEELANKLNAIVNLSAELEVLRGEEINLVAHLKLQAGNLSANRHKAVSLLEKSIRSMLKDVALPEAVFSVELTTHPVDQLSPNGTDQVRFLFSANKGVLPAEIGKVASGGELSRLMLCIKTAVASSMEMPTMIFDEIDTGVSGETALKLGKVMKKLSAHHQLITITHLPQIAGQGKSHYFVHKQNKGNKTFTSVAVLSQDDRLKELARMLSGNNPTEAAIANAKELLHP